MSFNFPSTPANGQTYTDAASGAQYVYQNGVWMQASAAQIKLTANPQNILVNGGFQISQENGTTSIVAGFPADQWGGNANGIATAFQLGLDVAGAPAGYVAQYNSAVAASPAAAHYISLSQYIEGNRTRGLGWLGALSKIPAVLNFKMSANRSGTYSVALRNAALDASIAFDLPYTTAEGWKEFTLPIPVPTIGTWLGSTNARSLELWFTHTAGSSWKAPTAGVWAAGSYIASPGITINSATINNVLSVADMQLLHDPDNTGARPPFRANHYDFDLNECRRYWRRLDRPMVYLGTVAGVSLMYTGASYSPPMRAVPVASAMSLVGAAYNSVGGSANASSGSFVPMTVDMGYFNVGLASMSGIVGTAQAVTLSARM